MDYYRETCFGKASCEFDFRNVGYQVGELDESGVIIDQERAGLFGLFSDECKLRMSDPVYLDVMSKIYIGIIGCKYDEVNFFNNPLHKEKIGTMVVIIDFASVLIMVYFFSKINTLNNELLEKVDDLRVQMKDFGI